ncbi:hypothetical protein FN846DRAFT_261887 [Sphaerosporella brunnea]|uniref:Peroxin 20 n=1 Tax=Sphaerosporella brunnea TaxID=1250544 RepID=A0A5J5ELS7_9PEZI|nr:hypothetical protein FN846DRAFT_261887 [Sphaerosporella brunnea]
MAALCGPTNALASLQKHTTADRSHHQQRFRPGLSSSQNFRSTQPNNAVWNEAEFESFATTGQVDPFLANQQSFQQQSFQQPAPPPPQQLDWASDFQRLEIGAASQRFGTPVQQQPQPNWGLEFAHRLQEKSQLSSVAPQAGSYTGIGMGTGIGYSDVGMGIQHTQQVEEFQFDESAFEKAFASVEKEVADFFAEPEPAAPVPEPFVEAEDKGKQKEQLQKDSDELARTAGQLLDSVQENTSAKFQNSTFLALMRKIRDHEVVVEGNDMVEAKR